MDRYILRRAGFSLVELSIVMGIIAVLTTAVLPIAIRSIEIKAGEKTIIEVGLIQEAAKKYHHDHKAWPINLVDMQTAGYLSPLWSLKNPWNDDYQISSTAKTLAVSTTVPDNVVGMLSFRLPASSVNGSKVTSSIGSGLSDAIVAGVIVAWSGRIVDIPLGWHLCDGTQGTPDLRDRFIVGARQDDGDAAKTGILGPLSQTGGALEHDHGRATGAHTLTIAEMPRHHHGYMATPWTGSRYDGHSSPLMTQQVHGNTDDTGGNQPHTHPIGSDVHVPPFYALAFIMKLP